MKNALFNVLNSFNWFRSRNYHCYNCGRNHPFISKRSKAYYVHSTIYPCKNGCTRSFSHRQWAVINRLTAQGKPVRIGQYSNNVNRGSGK